VRTGDDAVCGKPKRGRRKGCCCTGRAFGC